MQLCCIIYSTSTWQRNASNLTSKLRRYTGSLENIPLYRWKTSLSSIKVLKPVWTYGIELWGCASKSNIAVIQRYQSKLLRSITNAPWYVSNQTLHSDLHIPHVHTVFRERTASYPSHGPGLAPMEPLLHPPNNRRSKRRWTFDEIHYGSVAGRPLDHRQMG